MSSSVSSSKPCFRVEGLESRILLSAAPVDGGLDLFDEPDVFERVEIDEDLTQQSVPGAAGDDALWDGVGESEAAVFADAGQLFLESSEVDPFAGFEVTATSVVIGDSVWSGDNVIRADSIEITGKLEAAAGATLTLLPGSLDKGITLGKDALGFALSGAELQRLADAGFAELIIGSDQGSHRFTIDGLIYQGNLTLQAPLDGGSFDILSRVSHSGGQLTYIGPGATQNTSADTENEGQAILINDSVQLVYTVDNENTIRMVTTHNNHPNGADITITGDILGSSEARGGKLILDAGNQGTIFIGGNIGTSAALEELEIINAREVIIEGNVQVDALLIRNVQTNVTFGTSSSNFVRIDAEEAADEPGDLNITAVNNITFEGDVEVIGGDAIFNITGSSGARQLWFKGELSLDDGNLLIERAGRVLMSNEVSVSGQMRQVTGLDNTLFEANVIAGSIDLTATNQIRFEGQLDLTEGDLVLTTNNVDFRGGEFSVIGALDDDEIPVSNAVFRPMSGAGNMNIGAPVGAGTNFTFSTTDIGAIAEGWVSITFGYETGSTNIARVGTAAFLDRVAMHAGSFLINGPLSARTSLDLDAATGNIDVRNGANIRVVNQEVEDVFQSSRITFLAQQGDIEFRNAARLVIDNNDNADPDQGSLIELQATNGRIVDLSAAPNRQEAREIDLLASHAINLHTSVEELTANSTVSGAITINEIGGVVVHSAVTQNGAIALSTGGLTELYLLRSLTDSSGNTISVSALGDLEVGEVRAGFQGNVTLIAEGSITRLEGDPQAPAQHLIQGNHLAFTSESGQGTSGVPLEVLGNRITSNNSSSGAIRIDQLASRSNLELAVSNAAEASDAFIGIQVASGTNAIVTSGGIHSESAAGIALILNGGNLVVNGDISSQNGPIALQATQQFNQSAGTTLESNGGDVLIMVGASLSMAVNAEVRSAGGNIVLDAGGGIVLGVIDARVDEDSGLLDAGNVAVFSTGLISDHVSSDATNVYANELQLVGASGVGQLPSTLNERAIEINAHRLAVLAQGGVIAIHDKGDIITGVVSSVDLDLIQLNGDSLAFSGQSPPAAVIHAAGGDILLLVAGELRLESNTAATDSVSVHSQGAGRIVILAGSLVVEDDIISEGGAIVVEATNSILVTGQTVVATSGTASVAFNSLSAGIAFEANTQVLSGSGAIVIAADDSLILGSVTTAGSVGLRTSDGFIRSASGGDNDRVVVTANSLAIIAGGLVSGALDSGSTEAARQMLLTHVATLSLIGVSGSHHRIHNSRSLTVDTTSARADRYSGLMEFSDLEIENQSDFSVSGEGHIELQVDGDFTLASSRSIETNGTGSITISATGGINMHVLSTIDNEAGDISLSASGTIAIAKVSSADGAISVSSSNGAIIDSDPTEITVIDFATSGQLTLSAETGIGIQGGARDTLQVLLGTLNASTSSGGIFVSSTNSFAINGLETTTGLASVSVVSGGDLSISGITDAAGDVVISADGTFTQSSGSGSVIRSAKDIALRSGSDMTLHRVETPENVALEVEGALMGTPNPQQAAVAANGLLLNGVGSVGNPGEALQTEISRLAGTVTGGTLAIANSANLAIGFVSVESTPVGTADTLPAAEQRVQSADRIRIDGDGSGVFLINGGNLLIEDAGDPALESVESIPVLVQSTGAQTWNGNFELGGGPVTLRSAESISFLADAAFDTGGGSILIETGDTFALSSDSSLDRSGGDLIIDSGNEISIAGHIIGADRAALIAGQKIIAETTGWVQASELILRASHAIASADQALITAVSYLSAHSGSSGVYLQNSGNLNISNLAFGIISLAPDGVENVAFSGIQGGVVTRAAGAIQIANDGSVTIDPVSASIIAFPGSSQSIAFFADEPGSTQNGAEVVFEVVRSDSEPIDANPDPEVEDLRTGNPPSTLLLVGENTIDLRVFVRNGVSTLGEIVDAINAETGFPWTAVLVSGPADGSKVFTLASDADANFFSTGGSEQGIQSQASASFSGGAEAVSATAGILFQGATYTINVTAEEAGAQANGYVVRILDEGPIDPLDGGRLNTNTNSANIEWDGEEFLDIYINFGYTTISTIIERINSQEGIPFIAQIGGVFEAADLNAVVGDAPVLMESDLRAEATFRPQGPNNDFRVVATSSGSLYNGIQFIFVDNGTVPENGAVATFNGVTNRMTVQIQSGVSTANQVIAAINAQGTFSASLVPELNAPNNGSGAIQATRFFASGGAVEVAATVDLRMVGGDNSILLTAKELGDDQNGYEVRFVSDESLAPGQVVVQHQESERRILINVNPAFTSAAAVESAINAMASLPFSANAGGNVGTITFSGFPLTSGGSGSTARAEFVAAGDNNDFQIVANAAVPSLVNIRVFLIDDGSITDGSATAQYFTETRYLIVNLQGGVTTANTVIGAINSTSSVPVTATLLSGNNGSGVYAVEQADFSGGIEALPASVSYTLPSGVTVQLLAENAGVAANGVQVSFAVDENLAAGTANVSYFESGGVRILQLRVASESTPLEVLRDQLAAVDSIPFSLVVEHGDLSTGVGSVAFTDGQLNEGQIAIEAEDDIVLLGRIQSQTGSVALTSNSGDVVFDSEFARIEAIDEVLLYAGGSMANLTSLERPLIMLYGHGAVEIHTNSQALVSTEALEFRSYGDILILGEGLAIEDGFERDMPIVLTAERDVLIDAPLTVVPVAEDADGVVIEVVKSTTDGEGQDLTAANPVAISADNGTFTIYVLPGVATHADIVEALNAFRLNDLQVFFSNLGRQQGNLSIGGHTYFFTAVDSDVIENVNVSFADIGSDSVQVSFSGTTLDIVFGAFDNATVADLLVALNAIDAFNVSTDSADTSTLVRGADARDFSSDYSIEIIAATEDGEGNALTAEVPVRIGESAGTFTVYALAGVATRLDIQSALSATGLFGASVPHLNATLVVGDVVYFLDTGSTSVDSVNLEFRFVENGLVDIEVSGGVLEIGLNNIDAVTGQALLEALQDFGFTVFSYESDLGVAFDVLDTEAVFTAIPEGEQNSALNLDDPIHATLPVGTDGVFASTRIEVEGMLLLLNWRVPVVTADYESTTADDSQSQIILDDGTAASATFEYGSVGNHASTILGIDGVSIFISARAASIYVDAGSLLFISENATISGGSTEFTSGDIIQMHGSIVGGSVSMTAMGIIVQSGSIETVGAAGVTVTSVDAGVFMSGAASTQTESGNILYQAAEEITVVYLASSDGGRIDVSSGASIIDASQNDDLNLSTSGLITLTAQSGIGSIEEGTIFTSSGQLLLRNFGDSGDIVVTEAASGGTLNLIGLTQNALNGWSILRAAGGSVVISGPVVHIDEGSLAIEAATGLETTSTATLELNGGRIGAVVLDGSASLNADITTNGGDILLLVMNGGIFMTPGMTMNAGGGTVMLAAILDVQLAQIRSIGGSIVVHSEDGSIVRSANDGRTNILASILQLGAGVSVGDLSSADSALITDVDYLTVAAGAGALALRELNDLEIRSTSVEIEVVAFSKNVLLFPFAMDQSVVAAGNAVVRVGGNLVVQSIAGADPTLSVTGNLRIGAGGSITLVGDVNVSSGSVDMVSGADFSLQGDLSVNGGTLLIEAGQGFVQDSSSSVTVHNDNAAVIAAQSLMLNHFDMGDGALALTANGGNISRNADAPQTQIVADQLRLYSSAGIGSLAQTLQVDVNTLTALAADSIHLHAASDMAVDTVEVTVDTVSVDGETSTVSSWVAAEQSDLRSSSAGNILITVDGHLILEQGHNANGLAVETNGVGQIHIAADTLTANAGVLTSTGNITVSIGGGANWTSGAELRSTDGDLYVVVAGGVQMHDLARMVTATGNIGIVVDGDFAVSSVEAPVGYVYISTTGRLSDAGDSYTDIVADHLQIEAGNGVGTLSAGAVSYNPINVSANRISALIASGPFAVSAIGSLEVGLTTGSVYMFDWDGTTSIAISTDAERFGIQSSGGGSVSLVVANGLTIMSDGDELAGIDASGAGNIALNAATITIQDDVVGQTGHLTIQSTNALILGANTTVSTGGNGSISVVSQSGSITQQSGSLISSVDGDIVLNAATNVAVAFISTDAGVSVRSATGSITDVEPTSLNIEAISLRLHAQVAIGTGTNPLDIEVDTLSARTQNGGVFLAGASDITIGTTGANTWIVEADNSLTHTVLPDQAGILTGGSNGTISFIGAGSVTVVDAVIASQAGRILFDATDSIDLQANVASGTGSITFESGESFSMAAGITVTTTGTGEIHVFADADILTAANSRFVSASGNVVLVADGDLVLGGVYSEARAILFANNGSVLSAGSDAFDHEVIATRLLVSAVNGGVGSLFPADPVNTIRTQVNRIAAESGAGGINVRNAGNLLVDEVSVGFRTVNPNGSQATLVTVTLSDVTTLSGNGSIVLRSAEGSITLNDGGVAANTSVIAHGSGNIRIEAEHSSGNVTINADILSDGGSISILAGNSILQNADIISDGSNDIDLQTLGGSITMGASTRSQTGGSLVYRSAANMTIGELEAFRIYLDAGISIFNAGVTGLNIIADDLQLVVGQSAGEAEGVGNGRLKTRIDLLAARAVGGNIYLVEQDGLLITSLSSIDVRRVGQDGSIEIVSGQVVAGVSAPGEVSIEFASGGEGTVIVDEPVEVRAGEGNLQIYTLPDSGSVIINAWIFVETGNITINAYSDIIFQVLPGVRANDNPGVENDSIFAGGTIDLIARNGSILFDENTYIQTAGKNIRAEAANNIRFNQFDARTASDRADGNSTAGQNEWGSVSLIANAGVVNPISFNGDRVRVYSQNLRIEAGGQIGEIGNFKIESQRFAATASSNIYAQSISSVEVAAVADVQVQRVAQSGVSSTYPAVAGPALNGITTSALNGTILFETLSGSLSVSAPVSTHGTGGLRFNVAEGSATFSSSMTVGGSVSILVYGDIQQISGFVSNAGGSMDVESGTGSITMADGASAVAASQLRYRAPGDIVIGQLSAASLRLNTDGSILDGGNTAVDLTAQTAQLTAGGSIGQPEGMGLGLLNTDIGTLAATAGNGLFISDASSLTLGSVSAIQPVRISSTGTQSLVTGSSMSGVSVDGAAILSAETGITVQQGLTVNTADFILLRTNGSAADILIRSDVQSAGGHISIVANRSVVFENSGNLHTEGSGTIDVQAVTGGIQQQAGLQISTAGGNIVLRAEGDISLGIVDATASGRVGVQSSGGSILDSKARTASGYNIIAAAASLRAAANIGLVGEGVDNALDINATTLTAHTTSDGSVHISSMALRVDTVAEFSINRVAADATSSANSIAAQSDVRTAGNGHIILRSLINATLNGGLADTFSGVAVSASGNGNILLLISTGNSGITANAAIHSQNGSISVRTGNRISLSGNGHIRVLEGSGSIDLDAGIGTITQSANLSLQSNGGNITLRAGGNIQVGRVDARSNADRDSDSTGNQQAWGRVGIQSGGHITDSKPNTATAPNIFANHAILVAVGNIGVISSAGNGSNSIETEVASLAAVSSNGVINIVEASSLSIETVAAISSNRVAQNASVSTAPTLISERSGLTAAEDLRLFAASGSISIADGVTVNSLQSVYLKASDDVVLGGVISAVVRLEAGGSILSAGQSNLDVEADSIQLVAGHSIGQPAGIGNGHLRTAVASLAASADAGDIYIINVGELNLQPVSFGQADFAVGEVLTVSGLNAAGSIGLDVEGNVSIDQSITAQSGDLRITNTAGDITVNAVVDAGRHLYIRTSGSLMQNADFGAVGTLFAHSVNGVIDMAADTESVAESIRYEAEGDIVLSSIVAESGFAVISHNGTLIALSGLNITATEAWLSVAGSIGSETAPIDMAVSILSLSSGSDVFIANDSDLEFGTVTVVVNSVLPDAELGIAHALANGVTAIGNLSLVNSQSLHINAAVHSGGDLLLQMMELETSETVSADGDANLLAAGSVELGAVIDVAGDLIIRALSGALTMTDSSTLEASAVMLAASTDLTVSSITASVVVLESSQGHLFALSGLNITASSLAIMVDGDIAAADSVLEIGVNTIALVAGGDAFIDQNTSLDIGEVVWSLRTLPIFDTLAEGVESSALSGLNIGGDLALDVDGSLTMLSGQTVVVGASLSFSVDGQVSLRSVEAASVAIESVTGGIVLEGSVSAGGSGSILLDAQSGDLNLSGSLSSDSGHITLKASGSIILDSTTIETNQPGTISLGAQSGMITMSGGSSIEALASSLRLSASHSITVGNLRSGSVSIISNSGSVTNATGSTLNVRASQLRLVAAESIGQAERHLSVRVEQLAAQSATGSIFVNEATAVIVGTVSVSVTEVQFEGTETTVSDAALSGLDSGIGGNIVLQTIAGAINVNQVVVAGGNGNVRLAAVGGGLTLNANVMSGTGHLTLRASGSVSVSAITIETAAAGQVSLSSVNGSVSMLGNSTVAAAAGSTIRLAASGNLTLGNLSAGNVSLVSTTGAITNAAGTDLNVSAQNLRIQAQGNIGVASRSISTQVALLSAHSSSGDIFLIEATSVAIGSVSISHLEVTATGGTTNHAGSSQSGLASSGGRIHLQTVAGHLVVNSAVQASGSGQVFLNAAGSGSDIQVSANVDAGTGRLTLLAENGIHLAGNLSTDGGDIFIAAAGAGVSQNSATVSSGSANIRVEAHGDLVLRQVLSNQSVFFSSLAGSVLTPSFQTGVAVVIADEVRIEAAQNIGTTTGGAFQVRANRLQAIAANGDLHISTLGDVVAGVVDLSIARATADGSSEMIDYPVASNLGIFASGVLQLNANADFTLANRLEAGSLALINGEGWLRQSLGNAEAALTATDLMLNVAFGLGRTGAGALWIETENLFAVSDSGSIYLRLDSDTHVSTVLARAVGSVFIQQTSGELIVDGLIAAFGGSVSLRSVGNLDFEGASVQAEGNVDILANSITAADSEFAAISGNVRIRSAGALSFDSESSAIATSGHIYLQSADDMELARTEALGQVQLIAGGSVLSNAGVDSAKSVSGAEIRIRSGGSIGSENSPLFVDAERLDLEGGEGLNLRSMGGLSIGAYGLKVETQAGETLRIEVDGGALSSNGGTIIDQGSGTFVIESAGSLEINTLVRSVGGSIRIVAERITHNGSASAVIEAPQGSIELIAETGIGSENNPVYFLSPDIRAYSTTGVLNLYGLAATRITGEGMWIGGGNGLLKLRIASGNLSVESNFRHYGSGRLLLEVPQGALLMTNSGHIGTTTGELRLSVLNDIRIARIASSNGNMVIESLSGSIRRIDAAISGGHIISGRVPVLRLPGIVDLRVDADAVNVNGADIFRRNQPFIDLYLEP